MKDTELIIQRYEEIRDICIALHEIRERNVDLKETHDKILQVIKDLEYHSHELFACAYKLKEEQDEKETE